MRDSPFHIVNCLKSVYLTMFFVCTLMLLKGPWASAEILPRVATSIFSLSYWGCWWCTANGHSQNAFPFLQLQEILLCYAKSHKNALLWQQYPGILQKFTQWVLCRFSKQGTSFQSSLAVVFNETCLLKSSSNLPNRHKNLISPKRPKNPNFIWRFFKNEKSQRS